MREETRRRRPEVRGPPGGRGLYTGARGPDAALHSPGAHGRPPKPCRLPARGGTRRPGRSLSITTIATELLTLFVGLYREGDPGFAGALEGDEVVEDLLGLQLAA